MIGTSQKMEKPHGAELSPTAPSVNLCPQLYDKIRVQKISLPLSVRDTTLRGVFVETYSPNMPAVV